MSSAASPTRRPRSLGVLGSATEVIYVFYDAPARHTRAQTSQILVAQSSGIAPIVVAGKGRLRLPQ